MRGLFIQDKTDRLTISALNYYGAEFKLDVLDQESNTFVYENLDMTESVEPITDANTTVSEDRVAEVESIKVDSVDDFAVHDRILLSTGPSEIFRIVGIDTDNSELQLHKGIRIPVTTSTTLDKVGNNGLYYYDLTISTAGTFAVKAKDDVFNLLRTDSIKVNPILGNATSFQLMV